MNRLLIVLFVFLSVVSFGQSTDDALTTQAQVIRDETVPGANTKLRNYNMFKAIIDSKPNLLSTYANPSWISSLSWSKISSTPTTLSGYGITSPLPFAQGGTGLNTLGTALQSLRVNAGATALEYYTPSVGTIGGSTGATDNAVIRADGTGGSTVQSTAVVIDDSNNLGIGTASPDRQLHIERDSDTLFEYVARITKTRTSASGFAANAGSGIEFETETTAGNLEVGGFLESVVVDQTLGSEDFDFVGKLMTAGAAPTEKFRFKSNGRSVFSTAEFNASGDVLLGNTSLSGSQRTIQVLSSTGVSSLYFQAQGTAARYRFVGANTIIQNMGGAIDQYEASNVATEGTKWDNFRARGDEATPADVQSGDRIFELTGRGYSGGTYYDRAAVFAEVDGTVSGTTVPAALTFLTGTTAKTERLRITSGGGFVMNSTVTAGATTGNQTIDKPSGTVNFAATATTLTVTNSLVSATSIVFCVVRTNDATATIKNVVPGSGSFVITLSAAATAETSVGFFVIN